MIEPSQIKEASKKRQDQNFRFRSFLKFNADSAELDAQFLKLHNELFSTYDCCTCGNCCREYDIFIKDKEIKPISEYLGQTEEYLKKNSLIKTNDGYKIKEQPCGFLCADGRCSIQECKPSACNEFPFTNKPDRLYALWGVIDFSEVCPIVFEILERLKKIYHFH